MCRLPRHAPTCSSTSSGCSRSSPRGKSRTWRGSSAWWWNPRRPGFRRCSVREYSAPLYLMQGLVAIVLLLCCVNVGGLMLSKLHERRHEFAVRTAIGAAGMRIARQYLTEAFLIALAGAALGAAIAWYGTPWLLPFFRSPMAGVGMKLEPDQTVFLVTATSAVLTTLFFGGVPAWRAGRADPAGLMTSRTAAQRATAGRGFVGDPGSVVAGARDAGSAALTEHAAPAERTNRLRSRPRHDSDRARSRPVSARRGPAGFLRPHGGTSRPLVRYSIGRGHVVHADDRLPVQRALRGARVIRLAGTRDAGLQLGRCRLLPDNGHEDPGRARVRGCANGGAMCAC